MSFVEFHHIVNSRRTPVPIYCYRTLWYDTALGLLLKVREEGGQDGSEPYFSQDILPSINSSFRLPELKPQPFYYTTLSGIFVRALVVLSLSGKN